MTLVTADSIEVRLNELGVPPCDITDPVGQTIAKWVCRGGTMLVRDYPNGSHDILFHFDGESASGGFLGLDGQSADGGVRS